MCLHVLGIWLVHVPLSGMILHYCWGLTRYWAEAYCHIYKYIFQSFLIDNLNFVWFMDRSDFFFFACFRIRGTALPFSYFQLMFILVPLSSRHDVFAGVFSISCASCGVGLVNARYQNLYWTRPSPTGTLGDAESNGETLELVGTTLVL